MSQIVMNQKEFDSAEPIVPLKVAVPALLGIAASTIVGIVALQAWGPALNESLFGAQAHAYWDLARTSGIVAYLLMWSSVVLGLLITDRLAPLWPGGPIAFDLHQFTSLLGLGFSLFHGLILMGDRYIGFTPAQILIPFATNYLPFWVGLGQLAFYALIPITFSFYIRRRIGTGLWRALHFGTFVAFALITVHGLLAGSDTTNPLVLAMYALTGLSVMFLTLHRISSMLERPAQVRNT